MARAITPMTKIVFVANPNNPTATIVTKDEVEHFMARVPERTIVVFDEAYIEFAMARLPDISRPSSRGAGGRLRTSRRPEPRGAARRLRHRTRTRSR